MMTSFPLVICTYDYAVQVRRLGGSYSLLVRALSLIAPLGWQRAALARHAHRRQAWAEEREDARPLKALKG